ncbi:glycosyltransferase [Mumia qirimensis]|uniref:glycosyltransferase n=1 Tax=Mumia qirimensis TaxID=3234852 RepID=UPI00351D852C
MAKPRTLLVAATGGHLEQLYRIHERIVPESGDVTWVTHDDPQSRSLLAGRQVELVDYVPPRGYATIARIAPHAWSIIRRGRFDRVVSTGAGVALPFFLAARAQGVPCHYIESAARADGPSLTGRLVSRLPGVRLYSQYESWSGGRWNYRGSLFDAFEVVEKADEPISKVVVTLGTMRTYEFRRLVDRLVTVLPEVVDGDAQVLWQVGVTDAKPPFGEVHANVPNADLRAAIEDADLVVAHSGIGSAITALELGKRPVLVPRRPAFGEHVDDHQALIAGELGARDLAISREADELTADDLRTAARGRVRVGTRPEPFALVD